MINCISIINTMNYPNIIDITYQKVQVGNNQEKLVTDIILLCVIYTCTEERQLHNCVWRFSL